MHKIRVTMRSRYVLRLAICSALAVAITLLAACGISPAGSGTSPTATIARATATPLPPPTSLVVVRLSGFVEQNRVAPFQMTAQDAEKVVQLYNTARSLPRKYGGPSCPEDRAVGYELSFMHGTTIVLQVLMIGNCHMLEVSGLPGCRDWPPTFTAQVAATLGVPVTTLYPPPPSGLFNTAAPNGPFAQAFPTEPVLVSEKCSY